MKSFAVACVLAALATIPASMLVALVGSFLSFDTLSKALSLGFWLNVLTLPTALAAVPLSSAPFVLRANLRRAPIPVWLSLLAGPLAGAVIGAAWSTQFRGPIAGVKPVFCVTLGCVDGFAAGAAFAFVLGRKQERHETGS
jgi:uncharacterized membrane protein